MQDYILVNGTLYHYGIQGQEWGNRRYQYEDGSLTPEGRIRYGRVGIDKKVTYSKIKKENQKYTEKYYKKDRRSRQINKLENKAAKLIDKYNLTSDDYDKTTSLIGKMKLNSAIQNYSKMLVKAEKIKKELTNDVYQKTQEKLVDKYGTMRMDDFNKIYDEVESFKEMRDYMSKVLYKN